MSLFPTLRTMLPALEVRRLFLTGLFTPGNDLATCKTACAILMAQSALETAHWGSMWCYNFGNVRPGNGWTGDICQFRCNEYIGGKVVWFDAPLPGQPGYADPRHGSSFRAFSTSLLGAHGYLGFVQTRYAEAYAAALRGDASGFVHGLKVKGYFTAPEEPYRDAVVKLVAGFAALDDADGFYARPALDWSGLAAARAPALDAFDLDLGHSEESAEAYT